jgi:hypothetical protein
MCTLVILRRPEAAWPLLVAANRDELKSRPWRPPGRHWPDRPEVVAGSDADAGGSWLGVNDDGLVAAVLNRPGTLGPQPGKRSRGELVLEALDHVEAREAVEALSDLDPESYRPFNLVIADRYDAFWLAHAGMMSSLQVRTPSGAWREIDPVHAMMRDEIGVTSAAGIVCRPIPTGLSMITAHDLNDPLSPLISHFLPRFQQAAVPDPGEDDWQSWIDILGDRTAPDGNPKSAINVQDAGGFATVCSQLLVLPATGMAKMRFAAGPPDETPFEVVEI